jgi:hypothetical protein
MPASAAEAIMARTASAVEKLPLPRRGLVVTDPERIGTLSMSKITSSVCSKI